MSKERITVSVDRELAAAGAAAVAAGRAESVSAWVNAALASQVATERRLEALAAAVADFEASQGELTDAELAAVRRADADVAAARRSRSRRTG